MPQGPITLVRYRKIKVVFWVESQLGHGYTQGLIWDKLRNDMDVLKNITEEFVFRPRRLIGFIFLPRPWQF